MQPELCFFRPGGAPCAGLSGQGPKAGFCGRLSLLLLHRVGCAPRACSLAASSPQAVLLTGRRRALPRRAAPCLGSSVSLLLAFLWLAPVQLSGSACCLLSHESNGSPRLPVTVCKSELKMRNKCLGRQKSKSSLNVFRD